MRVSIRQPLHPFITAKAQELGIDDLGEVVNYLLLQMIDGRTPTVSTAPKAVIKAPTGDYDDLAGLLN